MSKGTALFLYNHYPAEGHSANFRPRAERDISHAERTEHEKYSRNLKGL